MTIQNYTSQVSAARSIGLIEAKLAASGATQILKEYTTEGKVLSIAFSKNINGTEVFFKLPAKVAECETILRARISRPRQGTLNKFAGQAERTAWKIILDWVNNQMAMLELRQAEYLQLFLPYVFDTATKQTYYEIVKAKGIGKLLPAVKE